MLARIARIMLVCVTGLSYLGYRQLRNTPASPTTLHAPISAPIGYQVRNIREQRALDLLATVGNTQPTFDILSAVVEWSIAEDGSNGAIERNNVWNTTQDGFNNTGCNMPDCVREYPTWEDGLAATVHTLTNGYYDEVVIGLQTNDPQRFKAGLIASPWAASHYNYGVDWPTAYQVVSSGKADPIPNWQQHINAGFYAVNCGAWGMQSGCQHFGTDIGGNGEGTPVYAPFGGSYTGCQDNGDSGPYIGKWIEYTADDGAQFLINHFRDSPFCGAPAGTRINAGDFIGTMRGDANHVHIQTTANGGLVDFEQYWETH
jgi:murein DD-endopeptidase MepM/ murein hydrolase activator NlpD